MFIGFVLSVLIIGCYAIYVGAKYATKKELEELRRRLDDLEKAPRGEKPKIAVAAEVMEEED
ncbi:MAG: hypothetical protein U9R36_04130 [Elusimicrobiota bacterium]|nr:hypothetical protein [Elusimicrobiota bacterium]